MFMMILSRYIVNKFNYYILKLGNVHESSHLRYKLLDTPITNAWSGVIERYYNDNYRTFDAESVEYVIQHRSTSIAEIWNEIVSAVDTLSKSHKDFIALTWIPKSYDEVTQTVLNKLHHQFHSISESAPSSFTTDDHRLLGMINFRIHRLEHANDLATSPAAGYVSASMTYDDDYTEIITPELRRGFDNSAVISKPGDMLLGYATLGKTLFEAYKYNDIQLVKDDGIRPQMYIKNNFSISMGSRQRIDLETTSKLISKWLYDNGLSHLIDPAYDDNYYCAEPVIAQLTEPVTPRQLTALFNQYDIIGYDLE